MFYKHHDGCPTLYRVVCTHRQWSQLAVAHICILPPAQLVLHNIQSVLAPEHVATIHLEGWYTTKTSCQSSAQDHINVNDDKKYLIFTTSQMSHLSTTSYIAPTTSH